MKQLLDVCGSIAIGGFSDTAFVFDISSDQCVELKAGTSIQPAKKDETGSGSAEIFSVAIAEDLTDNAVFWCAVGRADKSLDLFRLGRHDLATAKVIEATNRHNTQRKTPCLCFSQLKGETSNTLILVGGDALGDAYAYSLTDTKSKLLTGHTASILTGVHVTDKYLLTSDRDEKIRVSHFPHSYDIRGFLLGHEAFVSSFSVCGSLVVSCSGDSSLRLWDLDAMKEIHCFDFGEDDEQKRLPTCVDTTEDGHYIAVAFDESQDISLFRVNSEETEESSLVYIDSLQCGRDVLSCKWSSNDTLVVLCREPVPVVVVKVKDGKLALADKDPRISVNTEFEKRGLSLPISLIEKSNNGRPTLGKLEETRGAAKNTPWNRVERIEVAKKREKRAKYRKRKRADKN